jgi:hypothetical protein
MDDYAQGQIFFLTFWELKIVTILKLCFKAICAKCLVLVISSYFLLQNGVMIAGRIWNWRLRQPSSLPSSSSSGPILSSARLGVSTMKHFYLSIALGKIS